MKKIKIVKKYKKGKKWKVCCILMFSRGRKYKFKRIREEEGEEKERGGKREEREGMRRRE